MLYAKIRKNGHISHKNGRHFEKNQKFKKAPIIFICHPEYFILDKFQLYSTFTAKVDSKNVIFFKQAFCVGHVDFSQIFGIFSPRLA